MIGSFIHFQKGWMRKNYYDTKVKKKIVACGNCARQLYSCQTCTEKPCKVVFTIPHIRNCGLKSFLTSWKSSHYKHHKEKQFVQPHAKKQNKTKATEYQLQRGWVSHRYVLLISFLMGAWFNTEQHQNAPSPAASFIVLHHHVVGIHNFF